MSNIGISFSLRRDSILIYRDTLRALGEPECFRFKINETRKKVAIEVCKFGDEGYHVTPDFREKDEKYSYRIYSLDFLRMIWLLCDWNPNGTYRVKGEVYPEYQVVDFDLKTAELVVDE